MNRIVLIDKRDNKVLNNNAKYPRKNLNENIIGLDNNLEYLIEYEPTPKPIIDSRLYKINVEYNITNIPHPEYPNLKQYQKLYNIEKKSFEEIKEAIENREQRANEKVFDYKEQIKHLTICVGALIHQAEGNTLNAKQSAVLSKMKQRAIKFWQNEQRKIDIENEIINNNEPDLDTGWIEDKV